MDSQNGPNLTDHMLGGFAHWAAEFDDAHSPMDYDVFDGVDAGSRQFQRVSLATDQREYYELDLYLMGAIGPDEVGDMNLLSNITNVSGNTFSANKKRLQIDNFLWANGTRVPNAGTSHKQFKHGFCLLTKNFGKAHDLADRIDQRRRRFETDFRAAAKGLLSVDTTIGPLRREAQPGEITELTSGGYTSLHRHQVSPYDLNVTGRCAVQRVDPAGPDAVPVHVRLVALLGTWTGRPGRRRGREGHLLRGDRARRQRTAHQWHVGRVLAHQRVTVYFFAPTLPKGAPLPDTAHQQHSVDPPKRGRSDGSPRDIRYSVTSAITRPSPPQPTTTAGPHPTRSVTSITPFRPQELGVGPRTRVDGNAMGNSDVTTKLLS